MIKRWIFDDSDEIEISIPPWSGGYLTQIKLLFHGLSEDGDLKYFWVIFNNFWVIATSPKDVARNFQDLQKDIYWNLKNIEIAKCFFASN